MPEFPPIAELIPHAAPMLWLRRVVAHSRSETECEVDVAALSLLSAPDGSVPSYSALELAAQCAAAHARLAAPASHAPRRGLLLGTRRLELRVPRLAPNRALLVRVSRLSGAEVGPVSFEVDVRDAATLEILASGRISCFTRSV